MTLTRQATSEEESKMREKARDIMTPEAECIGEDETLQEAARTMARLDIGALPICGNDDKLHGVITDRDIVVKVVASGLDPGKVFARDLAQGRPITVRADAPVEEVISKMKTRKVRRLPVIDEEKRLVGIVSQADIARESNGQATGDLVRAVSSASW